MAARYVYTLPWLETRTANVCVWAQLQHQLELERSSRHDLEMHTKALELQKATLQEESAALQKTVEDCELL